MEATRMPLHEPLAEGQVSGWRLTVNMVPVTGVRIFTLDNPNFGTLTYGRFPGATYDSWMFRENGGGGAVIVPFVVIEPGKLFVGVVKQMRYGQGGEALNLPRGFRDPGETHFRSANREAIEELGRADSGDSSPIFELDGQSCNANSAFFDTSQKGTGVRFYGLRVDPSWLKLEADGNYTFLPGAMRASVGNVEAGKIAERILACVFLPADDVIAFADMFSPAGVARLKRHAGLHGYGPRSA